MYVPMLSLIHGLVPPSTIYNDSAANVQTMTLAEFRKELQGVATGFSKYYNASVYIGIGVAGGQHGEKISIGVADGDRDRYTPGKQQAMPDDLIPGGSITKPYTAVLAVQLEKEGRLNLDAPIHQYIDPWFLKQDPPRVGIGAIWPSSGGAMNRVTTRQLLSMRSGIDDYDDLQMLGWTTFQSSPRDFLPFDFIMLQPGAKKNFLYSPGSGASYSGIGYILAGMVLSAVTGAATWEDLQQDRIFGGAKNHPWPADKIAWYKNQTIFAGAGACTKYGPRVIPQNTDYTIYSNPDPNSHPKFTDWVDTLSRQSCLNGWTMGNGISTAVGVAQFYADLYAPAGSSSKPGSIYSMMLNTAAYAEWVSPSTFKRFTTGFAKGADYGLGQFYEELEIDYAYGVRGDKRKIKSLKHPGLDWGSSFSTAGWNIDNTLGMAIAINNGGGVTPTGMNTGLTWGHNEAMAKSLECFVQDVIMRFRAKPGIKCPTSDDLRALVEAAKK